MKFSVWLVALVSVAVTRATTNYAEPAPMYFCNEWESTKSLNFSFRVKLFGPEERSVVLGHYFRPAFRSLSPAASLETVRITQDLVNVAAFTPEGFVGLRVQRGAHFVHRWYSPQQYCLTTRGPQLDSIVLLDLAKHVSMSDFAKKAVSRIPITWTKCCPPGLSLEPNFCLKKNPCNKFKLWDPDVYFADSVNVGYSEPYIRQVPAFANPGIAIESIFLSQHLGKKDISVGVKSAKLSFHQLEWKMLDNETIVERVLCKKPVNKNEPWIPLRFKMICTDVMATSSGGAEDWTEVMLFETEEVQPSGNNETDSDNVFRDFCREVNQESYDGNWDASIITLMFILIMFVIILFLAFFILRRRSSIWLKLRW